MALVFAVPLRATPAATLIGLSRVCCDASRGCSVGGVGTVHARIRKHYPNLLAKQRVAAYSSVKSSAGIESETFDAVVVGGGPAGIAVVGNLLEQLPPNHRQLWIDPQFRSGRIGDKYREVPSNTRVSLFLKFAETLAPFRHILESIPTPNPATALSALQQDKGCQLSHAADLCLMLTTGIKSYFSKQVECHQGRVVSAEFDKVNPTHAFVRVQVPS